MQLGHLLQYFYRYFTSRLCPRIPAVEHSPHYPEIKGSNTPAGIEREKMGKKYMAASLTHDSFIISNDQGLGVMVTNALAYSGIVKMVKGCIVAALKRSNKLVFSLLSQLGATERYIYTGKYKILLLVAFAIGKYKKILIEIAQMSNSKCICKPVI